MLDTYIHTYSIHPPYHCTDESVVISLTAKECCSLLVQEVCVITRHLDQRYNGGLLLSQEHAVVQSNIFFLVGDF